ncbi:RICIN domain-containing protein [Bifidobacterium parmae]|nr:RICIN domain-containing protein [Bifidobacterium parmae]
MSRMTRAVRAAVASLAAAAMLGAVCVAPASALADVNADAAAVAAGASGAASGASGASVSAFKMQTIADASDDADAMPENPNAALPDKVSSEIADDATVVSEQYAATPEGELKDIETGETVTDPKIVGTESKQPDPLAKTDGESFIPVSAADVKEKVAANGGDVNAGAGAADGTNDANGADGAGNADAGASAQRRNNTADGANSSVKLAALQNNEYGAHWGSYNGTQAFYDARNNLFAQQAKGVIDVSTWQGTIDWQAAKNAGVEGAIIRLSFGWGNGFDTQARRNISECKRLGIPFGVYVFSYAESAADGASEGADVVNLLRQAGVNPGDLSYPVFYDLETWTYTGHKSPTSPSVYEGMVNAWYAKLQAAGYNNLSVYSYTSYLNTALNSASIHAKTRWVAQYGSTMQYTAFPTNDRGWQYTSGGSINGISGRVDLNAFGNLEYQAGYDVRGLEKLSLPKGVYYVDASSKLDSSLMIENGSSSAGAAARLQSGERDAMKFQFVPQDDGSYEIVNVNSGLALDVQGGSAVKGAVVQQWTRNNTSAQRWWLRVAENGGVFVQSVLGNWVLDLAGGNTGDGTRVQLYAPNASDAQRFVIADAGVAVPDGSVRLGASSQGALSLGVADGSYDDGAKLQLQNWSGADSQLFRFGRVGNGLVEVRSVNSGKLVEVASGAMMNGARIQQWPSNGSLAQRWSLRDAGNGAVALVNAKSGRVIDVTGGNMTAGTMVQSYGWNGTAAQSWSVVKAGSKRGSLSRLAGVTRYETADAVVAAGFERSDWVVVASGEAFPDALSASALAGALDAPVLLSGPDGGDVLASRIRSLGAKRAVLIGSEAALSSALEDRVRGLVSEHRVVRFGGSTRYGTSLGVLRDAPGELGSAVVWSDTVIVASGEGPYDALSASPLAYRLKAPVVLAGRDGLDEAMVRAVRDAGFRKVLLVGGESVVPVRVESQLGSLSVTRLAGATRYGTSAEVVAYALEHRILEADGVVLASGENYPDALAGGALAGRTGNVLALVDGPDARSVGLAAEAQSDGNRETAFVLGGPVVFGQWTMERIAAKLNKHIQ